MAIITYEAQHAQIKGGIQRRVDVADWGGLINDATDLQTLEVLIEKTPAPASLTAQSPTVMVHTLPASK